LSGMPKRAEAALREGKRYGGFERAVREEVAAAELAEKVGAARQKLTQAGVKIVEYQQTERSYYGPQLPRGVAELVGRNGYAWDDSKLKLDPKTHAKEPCHAAAIQPRNGDIVYLCTKPANHKGATGAASATPDEKAAARKERERDRAKALAARDANLELGRQLEKKFAATKIDARNMRLIADVLLGDERFGDVFGEQLGLIGFRYTDEASQTVVTRKDGTVSRIAHVDEPGAARKLIEDRLDQAKTPEEIMGVLLQALAAGCLADNTAVPPSQRRGHIAMLGGGYYAREDSGIRKRIEKLAGAIATKRGKA